MMQMAMRPKNARQQPKSQTSIVLLSLFASRDNVRARIFCFLY
jgi:hypothetical protein